MLESRVKVGLQKLRRTLYDFSYVKGRRLQNSQGLRIATSFLRGILRKNLKVLCKTAARKQNCLGSNCAEDIFVNRCHVKNYTKFRATTNRT